MYVSISMVKHYMHDHFVTIIEHVLFRFALRYDPITQLTSNSFQLYTAHSIVTGAKVLTDRGGLH